MNKMVAAWRAKAEKLVAASWEVHNGAKLRAEAGMLRACAEELEAALKKAPVAKLELVKAA